MHINVYMYINMNISCPVIIAIVVVHDDDGIVVVAGWIYEWLH